MKHLRRGFVPIWLGIALCASGCSHDFKAIADRLVETKLLDNHEKCEAIPFFEGGGRFYDNNETTTVDRDVVLPLLKRLHEVDPTEQWAVLRSDKKDRALALVIELPRTPETVDRMAEVVEQADANYSGFILQQWGHDWLKISLIDKETYEFLKKSDPDIDKQR